MYKLTVLSCFLMALFSCNEKKDMENNRVSVINYKGKDMHTFSNSEEAKIKHLNWEAFVDFENKIINAIAQFDIEKYPNAEKIILDTKGLDIEKVWSNDQVSIDYELKSKDDLLGTALLIPINKSTHTISIAYKTKPNAEALQWLNPNQTSGNQPFLFSQSQAILCRSWIPIQDSPGIRFTFNAKVEVPKGFLALMSASNPQEVDTTGVYEFQMEQPIPAYLMSLAVGDLQYQKTGKNTGFYAEPATIDKANQDLKDLQSFLETAENLYGKYRWEQFDVLVLPPSFPFGGMENPRLTFATPTILAGDKSLVSLIAHELAHSWSGNLVTNATWNDFWLNEGFTVYFEYRIMEAMYGRDYSEMLASISYKELKEEVKELIDEGNEKDTQLKLNLEGRNPDVGMTAIAYDKGYFFLRRLEELVGREKFDIFLNQYFGEFAFQSINTEKFLYYLEQNLFGKNDIKMPEDLLQNWVYESGIPQDIPAPNSQRFLAVNNAIQNWLSTENIDTLQTSKWSTHEFLHFFHQLPDSITYLQVQELDQKFNFTNSGNAEILSEWFLLAIKADYRPAFGKMEEFLINTGRKKFLMPIYTKLYKSDNYRALALRIYRKARENYHFVSYNSLDKLLNYSIN
ncbi:M1 family metallopeptidase [Marivirga arenosa]|uniref:Aminopeptidase N n=1 Tax=Marivirga arenosa TaxID=3059076 RepID=A0AA49GGB4_9BACT|nr:M1 family metallopeptidase [Marivirga sp. ABR2-2]WKK86769.2 M1 family metallopeptidase [Marivirga sp. ABR2-2]